MKGTLEQWAEMKMAVNKALSEVGSVKPRRDFYKWMWSMELKQRLRVQRRMWELYDENRRLGGKVWKDIEAAYSDGQNQNEH